MNSFGSNYGRVLLSVAYANRDCFWGLWSNANARLLFLTLLQFKMNGFVQVATDWDESSVGLPLWQRPACKDMDVTTKFNVLSVIEV